MILQVWMPAKHSSNMHPEECRSTADDVSSYSALQHLTQLQLEGAMITSLRPLKALTQLQHLRLRYMEFPDVSPLVSLTRLSYLNMAHTGATCISPLSACTQLSKMELSGRADQYCGGLASLRSSLASTDVCCARDRHPYAKP